MDKLEIERMSKNEAQLPKGFQKPSKEELERSYDELRSTAKVAEQYEVSGRTVCNWMEKYGIERINTKRLPEDFQKPSKEELERLYKELRSTIKIAEKYEVADSTIRKWMEQYSIERNTLSESHLPKDFQKPSEEELKRLYNELGSTNKVAKQYEVSRSTIYNWMDEFGIGRNGNSEINEGELEKLLETYAGGK